MSDAPKPALDLEGLKRIAEAATPGARRVSGFEVGAGGTSRVVMADDGYGVAWLHGRSEREHEADAAFLTAFDPPTILALIAHIEQLEAARPSLEDEDAVGSAEREVGRYIYRRIERLMDAKPGTPEGAELKFLADIVGSIEEYGEEACADHTLQPPAPETEDSLATALSMTGLETAEDLIDMANVGQSLMERIGLLIRTTGPFHNWSPADDPAEIVFDLVNHYEDAAKPPAAETEGDWVSSEARRYFSDWRLQEAYEWGARDALSKAPESASSVPSDQKGEDHG